MNYPGEGILGVPVILGGRPGRHRGRLNSEHRQQVYLDANGYLYPAAGVGQGLQRSASSGGHGRRSPTQIYITNNQLEEHSPVRAPRRRSAHHRNHDDDDDDDEWDDRAHSPHRRHRPRRRHSRSPSEERHDPVMQERLRKLDALEAKEREEEQKRKFAEAEKLKRIAEEEKKKKEEEMKKAAIKEHAAKQLEKEAKDKKEKEEAEKEFRERVKATFGKAGYSDESIERILEREGKAGQEGPKKIMDLGRPTYIKVHRKHLSPDTLDAYELPWEFDERDGNYILIKRWIPEHDQDILFEHTRKMREGRLLPSSTLGLKKERGELLVVRRKSPNRRRSVSRNWMFT